MTGEPCATPPAGTAVTDRRYSAHTTSLSPVLVGVIQRALTELPRLESKS